MPRLTAQEVKNAEPAAAGKRRKLYDERGLVLVINDKGARWWLYRYTVGGKRKELGLGAFPTVGLADARMLRDKAAIELAGGVDPVDKRATKRAVVKAEVKRSGDTFEVLAREWHAKWAAEWTAGYADRVWSRIARNVLPFIGDMPMDEVGPGEMLDILRPIEARGTVETAYKVHSYCSGIFRYAVANRRAPRNPCADFSPRDALSKIPVRRHFAAITDPAELGQFLRDADAYVGRQRQVEIALRVMPRVFVRPTELRSMRWADVDLESARWQFAIRKGKTESLFVPLSRQVVGLLQELEPVTGQGEYVFPSPRARDGSRPMSENALLVAMRAMGWDSDRVTGHGFRATARTLLDEVLGFRVEWIEMQLAHVVKDMNGRAYNRTKFIKDRTAMMQAWSDYLDGLKSS